MRGLPAVGTPQFHFYRLGSFVEATRTAEYRRTSANRRLVHHAILAEYRQIKAFGLREAHEARLLVNAATSRLGWVIPS